MKLFDKIKRRARDVIRAAKGEPWGELTRPVEFKRTEAKVETYRVTSRTGPFKGGEAMKDTILGIETKHAAYQLGVALLEKGLLALEVTEDHDPAMYAMAPDAFPGYCIALEVKVVRPDRTEGVQR